MPTPQTRAGDMPESDRLTAIRKVLFGVAEGVRDSTLMNCRSLANLVLKDCAFGLSFVNELRVRPVNSAHLFDSVIGTVKKRAMKVGYQA